MKAILAVEHGWQGMRELSLAFARQGAQVDVLIKGAVAPEVLAMVTGPNGMRITAIPRVWFLVRLMVHCAFAGVGSRPVCVIAQRRESPRQERVRRWLERLGRCVPLTVVMLEENSQGNHLITPDGRPLDPSLLFPSSPRN